MINTYHLACGCKIHTQPNSSLANADMCPLHSASKEMYEALKSVSELPFIDLDLIDADGKKVLRKVRKSIKRVEGKEKG